jgi:hypothetical protein
MNRQLIAQMSFLIAVPEEVRFKSKILTSRNRRETRRRALVLPHWESSLLGTLEDKFPSQKSKQIDIKASFPSLMKFLHVCPSS